ncbi:hypothetical protein BH20ACT6_BH20ACT6_05360 [soil metagenome]
MADSRLALVVATDRYDDPTLHGLAAPAADADALVEVLGDPDRGGFDVDVLHNATSWVVAEHVETLLGDRHRSDLVLLHFSCHGLKDEAGELFLAASNTRPTLLASTAVDSSLVNRLMRRSRAQRIVLLLDCCYGGAFERGAVSRADDDVHVGDQFAQGSLGGGRGRVVITASSAMEYALEGADLTAGGRPAPSLFTGALVEGLRSGEADRDQDGQIGLDELYEYVYDRVQEQTPNQTPSRWVFGLQGDLFIARNPRRRILAAPLSTDIQELAAHPTAGVRIGAVHELAGIAAGVDLSQAAGAAVLLRQLCNDDSRRVAQAAAEVLDSLAPRPASCWLDLGRIPVGTASTAEELEIGSSPLTLASLVETSGPQLRAQLQGTALQVEVTPADSGPLRGWVKLSGAAGEAHIDVVAEAVETADAAKVQTDSAPARLPWSAPMEAAPTPSTQTLPPTPPPAVPLVPLGPVGLNRPSLVLVGLLVLAGAVATAGANLLPTEYEGFVAVGSVKASWWLYVPATATALALVGLSTARPSLVSVAVGVVAGVAAWAGSFWFKMSVAGLSKLGPEATIQGWLNTGLWAQLVAFLLLGVAVVMVVAGSADLRAPVTVARSGWSLLAGGLVLSGAALTTVDAFTRAESQGRPRVTALAAAILVVCVPVAVTALGMQQRRAVLAAATTLLLLIGGRDVFLLLSGELTPHLASTVGGSVVVLLGCFVGQGRLRETADQPTRTHPPDRLSAT